ncbi:MAG: ATP synthase F1 subunit delta [Planctomycetaceae bacterium]|nr:ATP synthase F1 subunit delta [Planctomycetales bacterium]MCB9927222.1 ATP synthase F1 subunit delta [Planctomycetaceae bacterium]
MTEARDKVLFDPGQQYLGTVYAKALLGAAEKVGNADLVVSELGAFVDEVLANVRGLSATLASPRVAIETKASLLDKALGGKVSTELLNFLKVVARHGRFDCLGAVRQAAQQQLNDLRGRVEVFLYAAQSPSHESIELISNRLKMLLGKDVDLQIHVDQELIGGVKLRIGDTVYDASVANRLVRLKNELLSKTGQQLRDNLDRFALAD